MSGASTTKYNRRAVLVDQTVIDEALGIIAEFQRHSRNQLILENDLTESQLAEVEKNGADSKLPVKDQIELEATARRAKVIARTRATIELVNEINISDIEPSEIARYSGVGRSAIKKLTLAGGDYGGARISVGFDAESIFSANWSISGTVETVERADARIAELMAQATRPWWVMNS